jgi:hypothetical protein
MPREEPLEPPLLGRGSSIGIRWLASLAGAAVTAVWVFDTTAGAYQRAAWLMERARPACVHSSIGNEELHRVVEQELEANGSKKDALRAIVARCQSNLRAGRPELFHG